MKNTFPLPVESLSFWRNVESNRLYAIHGSESDECGCFEFKKGSWVGFKSLGDFNRNTDVSELDNIVELSSKEAKSLMESSKS